jgi:hypothetical protein
MVAITTLKTRTLINRWMLVRDVHPLVLIVTQICRDVGIKLALGVIDTFNDHSILIRM